MDTPPLGFCSVCTVLNCIDGDTLDVEIKRKLRVRLLDCWAPETRTKNEEEKLKGRESKEFLSNLLFEREDSPQVAYIGKQIVLYIPADEQGELKDIFTFGRVLGRIFVDEKDVSEIMVEKGYATKTKQ